MTTPTPPRRNELDETYPDVGWRAPASPAAAPDRWATLVTEGEAAGCYPCDTCGGFRARGLPCAVCRARAAAPPETPGRARLVAALRDARAALDRDRTGLAAALNQIREEVRGRYWMRHGSEGDVAGSWGSYPYPKHTTDTLRREIGWAFNAIDKIADEALRASGKIADRGVAAADLALASPVERETTRNTGNEGEG